MILEIQQYASREGRAFKCRQNGNEICHIYGPMQLAKEEYFFEFLEMGRQLKLVFNQFDKNQGIPEWIWNDAAYAKALHGKFAKITESGITRFMMRIYEGEEVIGSILGDLDKTGVFQLEYRGARYHSMLARLEQGESCLCVFDSFERMIGEIYRKPQENYGRDFYRVYAEQEEWKELLILLTIHIDAVEFDTMGEDYKTFGRGNFYIGGEKYFDSQFIQRIAEREHYDINKIPERQSQGMEMELRKKPEVARAGKTERTVLKIIYKFGAVLILGMFAWRIVTRFFRRDRSVIK